MNAILDNIRRGVTVKEIVAVIVVTCLIWLYAEAESVATTNVETFVRLEAPAGSDRVVKPVDPNWSSSISIRLQGARGSIDAARSAMARGVDLTLGTGGIPTRPGQHNINLQSVIQEAVLRDHTGVVVASVDPPGFVIDVEPIVKVADIPIRFVPPEGLLIAGDPVVDPPVASLTAPQSVIDRATASGEALTVKLRINSAELESLPAGVSRTFVGTLELPGVTISNPNISMTPQTASVTVRIQSQLSDVVLPSVPIWEMIPPPEADNWTITIEPPFLTDLTLAGPTDLVKRVESGEIRVVAVVECAGEVLEAGGGELSVQFPGLPAGLQVASESPRVNVTAVRRDAIANSPQP
ncbi:MAG: hypothetical protein H6814_04070 [Phycisphaeraceae bacterium]|nr:hypothetical protein [Phycisphaeraceae bacterium]